MKKDKLIALQQLEIQTLKEKIAKYEKAQNKILSVIYNGALNDFYNQYSKKSY